MAFDWVFRAQVKWRGLLVYVLLQAATHFTTDIIFYRAESRYLRLFALVADVATTIYCVMQEWQLLNADREGDEGWPPLWS